MAYECKDIINSLDIALLNKQRDSLNEVIDFLNDSADLERESQAKDLEGLQNFLDLLADRLEGLTTFR